MKIVLTGATGLVGKEIGKKLVQKGHEVVVLSRRPEETKLICPFPHESYGWGDTDRPGWFEHIDGVIHLAGANISDKRWSESYKKIILHSRKDTTEKLVHWANQSSKLQFFISTSATGIYPESDEPMKEETPVDSSFLARVCQAWEEPIKSLNLKVRSVILRVGVVMSEKGGALSKMVPPIQSGVGGALGSGQQMMNWIDIEDLVNMYLFAMEKDELNGTFNAVAPESISNKELTRKIAHHLGASLLLPVPNFALRLAVGEMATVLVASQAVCSEKIQAAGFKYEYGSADESIAQRVAQLKSHEVRKIYELWLPQSIETIFEFFCDEKNLEVITPEFLQFKVLEKSTEQLEAGTLIDYKLRLQGLPFHWRTKIDTWNPPHSFSDTQLKGPYSKWHHAHRFESLGEGTLMTDRVDYILPMGALGRVGAGAKVHNDVENIFDFRNRTVLSRYS